jgi:hypothetical protein
MRVRIHGAIVVKPVKFPDDLDIRIFPLRSGEEHKSVTKPGPRKSITHGIGYKNSIRLTRKRNLASKPANLSRYS